MTHAIKYELSATGIKKDDYGPDQAIKLYVTHCGRVVDSYSCKHEKTDCVECYKHKSYYDTMTFMEDTE